VACYLGEEISADVIVVILHTGVRINNEWRIPWSSA